MSGSGSGAYFYLRYHQTKRLQLFNHMQPTQHTDHTYYTYALHITQHIHIDSCTSFMQRWKRGRGRGHNFTHAA